MAAVDLKALVDRLNEPCRRALEAAAGLTLSRTHYTVEVEHWLLKLLDDPRSDLTLILRRFEIDPGRLQKALGETLDRFRTGNARPPALAPQLTNLIRDAWQVASLAHGATRIRSGHLVLAMLGEEGLASQLKDSARLLAAIQPDTLKREFDAITAGSAEAPAGEEGAAGTPAAGAAPSGPASQEALAKYTIDLTARAKAGQLDPVFGREAEIRQLVDVLLRRRQNNPILTGEAGVGKTAVVEGLALRVAAGDVPKPLEGVRLLSLDLALLQAGAGIKGEFESRLRAVIDEVKASPVPIIVFIDEAHTLIGAGGQAGQGDAANLLKPALARGEFRTIAATTWAEYKKYFEKDAALTRRFQVVKVEEPEEAKAVGMMRGLVPVLEKHHKVRVLDEAVREAVRLGARYIPARQLPDKAVSLLDTACARVAMSQGAVPGVLEDLHARADGLDRQLAAVEREARLGMEEGRKLEALRAERAALAEEIAAVEARLAGERTLAAEIMALTGELEAVDAVEDGLAAKREALAAKRAELARGQGDHPLVLPVVDGQAVAGIVAAWTGIPVGRMLGDELRLLGELEQRLGARIVGQDHALKAVAETVRTARAGLGDPSKPTGAFLMVGPSGVGKTETALAIADMLYGGEQSLTVINMSEFKEEHKVSMLTGAPPGYIGYGEGGVLTEAVRRRPYGVVLLDEMEKAHPGVQDVFYQMLDKGILKDGEGRDIDFRNTVVIMTSNAASELVHKLCDDPLTRPTPETLADELRPELLKHFKAAFLGRVTVVPYFPLERAVLASIIRLKLDKIGRRLSESYGAALAYDAAVVERVLGLCNAPETGARMVDNVLGRSVLPEVAARCLARLGEGRPVERVMIVTDGAAGLAYEVG